MRFVEALGVALGLADEAGHPSVVVRSFLVEGDEHRSYLGWSECLGSRPSGHLDEQEGGLGHPARGVGAVEGRRHSWGTRREVVGTRRFPGLAKPSCLLSRTRR